MGNGVAKLAVCFSGNTKRRRRRRFNDVSLTISEPLHENLGHSFFYIRPDPETQLVQSESDRDDVIQTFRSISGASVSANTSTASSTSLTADTTSSSIPYSSVFESSDSFASVSLQAVPRGLSGPIDRGFLSGPVDPRSCLCSGPIETKLGQRSSSFNGEIESNSNKKKFMGKLKRGNSSKLSADLERVYGSINGSLRYDDVDDIEHHYYGDGDEHDNEFDNEFSTKSLNLQWAQGKAGEDRVHIMISEKTGWVFVGIYDGFNGPDAPDFLLHNLYSAVRKEFNGLLWDDEKLESNFDDHGGVLAGLAVALKKTEKAYLEMAMENPELAMMGSCVLAMLMKGDDIYLMNVGDSRAVLSRKVKNEDSNRELYDGEEVDMLPILISHQLTMDHSTNVEEELFKSEAGTDWNLYNVGASVAWAYLSCQNLTIGPTCLVKRKLRESRKEHPDDRNAISNGRVKGSVKVTRAFGAGFLKQPKWNNAVLEAFRIEYIGNSPYLSCSPSLYHHKLSLVDRFLILSSDGLYEYFTNEEAIAEVQTFIAVYPTEDPAQHLIEEVLLRAAKRAGMDFYDLLDIPQGERRRYHDDVTVIIVSFEGRIWRSSVYRDIN